MVKKVHFVTANSYKFQIAKKSLEGTGIELIQEKIDTPEIQATKVEEVASFSAKWAAEKTGKPVAVTDSGYFIDALNGFPGPFVKYVNNWLSPQDLVNLMKGKINRRVVARDSLAYCEPGKDPIVFSKEWSGTIAEQPVFAEGFSTVDQVFIPDGFGKVQSEISEQEMISFWAQGDDPWKQLVSYLL